MIGQDVTQSVAGLTGLKQVFMIFSGDLSAPPFNDLIPFTLSEPEPGIVRLSAVPGPQFHNPMAIVHGGWMMTLMDSAMGLAALTTLNADEICPTHETSVKFLRPVTAATGPVMVTGRVLSRGGRVITVDGRAETAGGTLLAVGTSTCLMIRNSAGT